MANPRPENKLEPWKDPAAVPYIRIEKGTTKKAEVTSTSRRDGRASSGMGCRS